MRIGELGKAAGVNSETIRYYERAGLLPPPRRQANGYRSYGPAHLERLAFVRHCRALDMPLADVRLLLDFLDRPRRDCGDVNRLIGEQLARVRARIKSMRALERQLQALRFHCDAQRPTEACGILCELVTAARGEGAACRAAAPPPAAG